MLKARRDDHGIRLITKLKHVWRKMIPVIELSGKKSDWEGWLDNLSSKMDKRNSFRKCYYCKEFWHFKENIELINNCCHTRHVKFKSTREGYQFGIAKKKSSGIGFLRENTWVKLPQTRWKSTECEVYVKNWKVIFERSNDITKERVLECI